jgi:hypothetical protein
MNSAVSTHKYTLTGALIVHKQHKLETQRGMVTGTFLYLYTNNFIQGRSNQIALIWHSNWCYSKLHCTVWQYKQVQNKVCFCYHWSLKIGTAVGGYSHMVFYLKQKKWTGLVERNHMKMVWYGSGERERNIREVTECRM